MPDIDYAAYEAQVLECDESGERDAVLSNIRARAYTRVKDVIADIADLKQRDERRRALDAAQAAEAPSE